MTFSRTRAFATVFAGISNEIEQSCNFKDLEMSYFVDTVFQVCQLSCLRDNVFFPLPTCLYSKTRKIVNNFQIVPQSLLWHPPE